MQVDDFLQHYGVMGMKWGRRKARAGAWLKEAGRATASNIRHPIITSRANNASIKTGSVGSQLRRRLLYQNTKDLKDVNRRVDVMLKQKADSKKMKAKAKAAKPVVDSWLREAGKVTLSQYTHPIITFKANRQSKAAGSLGSSLRRSLLYQNTRDLKDVNRRIDIMVKAKKR